MAMPATTSSPAVLFATLDPGTLLAARDFIVV